MSRRATLPSSATLAAQRRLLIPPNHIQYHSRWLPDWKSVAYICCYLWSILTLLSSLCDTLNSYE